MQCNDLLSVLKLSLSIGDNYYNVVNFFFALNKTLIIHVEYAFDQTKLKIL